MYMQPSRHAPELPLLLKEPEKRKHGEAIDPSLEEQLHQGEGGARLVCVACGLEVTYTGARTQRNSSHRHVFCNPAGIVYEIGCFALAPGCAPLGLPSSEFTWFPGHVWQVGVCRSCGEQLGWKFNSSSGTGFFGLILERLAEEETPETG